MEAFKKGTTMNKSIITLTLILIFNLAAAQSAPPRVNSQKSGLSDLQQLQLAIQILGSNGFLHNKNLRYGNFGQHKHELSKKELLRLKLQSIKLAQVGRLKGFTLSEVTESLDTLFAKAHGINIIFDTSYDPEKIKGLNAEPAKPNNVQIDQETGLPIGGGLGGEQQTPMIDPTTGLPIGQGGQGGQVGQGLPPIANGQAFPPNNGFNGGIPLIGMGNEDLNVKKGLTFDPDEVVVKELPSLRQVSAIELLDLITAQLSEPITYRITDNAIVFLKADPRYHGFAVRRFALNLNNRTLKTLGMQLPKLNAGGGAGGNSGGGFNPFNGAMNGGINNGGGMGMGGINNGGMNNGGMMGNGFNGGMNNGFNGGMNNGFNGGMNNNFNRGMMNNGYNGGFNNGFNSGFNNGFSNGLNSVNRNALR